MNSLLCAVFFAAAIFSGRAEDKEKPCYDWDKELKLIHSSCDKCKKDAPQADVERCVYKLWELTDEEGNVLASKIRDSYLIGLDESKTEAVKEAIKDCGKDKTEPMKDMREVEAVWNCTDDALTEICPEMKEKIADMEKDPNLKGCLFD